MRITVLAIVLFGLTVDAIEPWRLKYSDGRYQQVDRPRSEMMKTNSDQPIPSSGQAESDYRWIVMDPKRQGYNQAARQPANLEPSTMMRQAEQIIPSASMRNQQSVDVPSREPVMAQRTPFGDQANGPEPQVMRYYDDMRDIAQPHKQSEQVEINKQPNVELNPSSSPPLQIENQQTKNRWDQHVPQRVPPTPEYVLPPLYENAFAYQQPTFIQPANNVQDQMLTENVPRPQYSDKPLLMPMYPSPVIGQPMYASPQSSTVPQVIYPNQQTQQQQSVVPVQYPSGMSDEYTRTDSASNDLGITYCADYSPEERNQVLFKDPNSQIHFLTCIGRNQLRRMVCPRYTVFNEYSKRCVQRQHANDKCGPCENGGECVQDPATGTFRCECTINFRGDNCEIFNDPCKRNPCGSNGLCFNISTAPGFLCQCADHVFNDNCNELIENNCNRLGSKRFYGERGNLFVHCSDDGLAFVKKCPAGMVFNDAKETCTFPPSYAREVLIHPPGSFRADTVGPALDQQDAKMAKSRPKRSTIWAW